MKHNSRSKLERDTFRIFYSDGIMDLAFGSMLIIFAINVFTSLSGNEESLIMKILVIPVILLLVIFKTFITSKRLGYVKFSPGRNRKRLAAILIATAAVIITAFIFYLSSSGKISREQKNDFIPLLIEFTVLVVIFSLIAYFTDYYNLYIVGLAMGIGSPLSIMLEPYSGTRVHTIAIMFLAGLGLFLNGIFLLIKFLNRFPKTMGHEE